VLPHQVHALYAPKGGLLLSLAQEHPQRRSENLFSFDAPLLRSQDQASLARQAAVQWQSGVASLSPETRDQWQSLTAQSGVARAEGQLIRSDLRTYRLQAPFDGRLHKTDPDLQPGQWTLHAEKLGQLVGAGGVRVVTYVPEVELLRLRPGQRALFVPDSGTGPTLQLLVETLHTDRARTLNEPELALSFGGSVPVREQKGLLFPEGAFYRVELVPLRPDDGQALSDFKWRGRVSIAAAPEPLLRPWLRAAASVLIREAGF
jgi:putative peptide zinc metalloprotease protein